MLELVTFELHYPGRDDPQTIVMEAAPFDELAQDAPMAQVIRDAKRVGRSSRSPGSAAGAGRSRINYATMEYAGKPHKGRVTETERKLVQENFDAINERLEREGDRLIDLGNPDHVSRYNLEALVEKRSKARE